MRTESIKLKSKFTLGCQKTGQAERTARKWLNSLVDKGYLLKNKDENRNIYSPLKTPEDSAFTGIAESNDPVFQIEKILKSVRIRHAGTQEIPFSFTMILTRSPVVRSMISSSCMPACRIETKQDTDFFLRDKPEDPAMPIDAESLGSEIYKYEYCSHCKERKLCKIYSGKPYCRECAIRIFNDKNWGKFGE